MVVEEYLDVTRLRPVVLFSFLLGVLVSGVALAAVYVFMGGPDLARGEVFTVANNMLFVVTGLGTGVGLAGLMYWFTRDVSVSLAPVVGVVFALVSGFEDLVVYALCIPYGSGGCGDVTSLPYEWPWLDGSVSGYLSGVLGLDVVTTSTLLITVVLFFLVSLVLLKILEGLEESFLGVQL